MSQQAVLKHLAILERHGFVVSFEAESEFAAPKRKYYQLNKSCLVAVGITGDAVQFVFHDILAEEGESTTRGAGLRSVTKRLTELENEKSDARVVELSDSLLQEINQRLKDLASSEIELLRLKQKITSAAHRMIRESFEEELERQILYSIIGAEKRPDANALSEKLDTREREIDDAIRSLRRRLRNDSIFPAEKL